MGVYYWGVFSLVFLMCSYALGHKGKPSGAPEAQYAAMCSFIVLACVMVPGAVLVGMGEPGTTKVALAAIAGVLAFACFRVRATYSKMFYAPMIVYGLACVALTAAIIWPNLGIQVGPLFDLRR